ncbi:MAG: endolytic transglycosylase MltG, partial [bacterium]|nr:endolytic transglycosylase MltG [bacterium]
YHVGEILQEQGLVEHELFFRLAIRLDKKGGSIRHGDYDLPKGASPTELLHLLYDGPNVRLRPDQIPDDQKLTIPEGLTIAQVAELTADPEAFVAMASDKDLIARMGIEAKSLEGFLTPETYFFDEPPTSRDVVERMLEHFEQEYAAISETHAMPEGMDTLKLVTVASLVEREARLDEERALVAAVIYNRLEKGMALDLDATLQYALGKYGQRMLEEDKEVDSPYNTYRNRGLPPGPICSPGVESLRAAFAPADEPYLFFVSNADGKTHTFSKTLSEHNRAVARYRREMRDQRRRQRQEEREASSEQ